MKLLQEVWMTERKDELCKILLKSCHMVVDNMDHYFHLGKYDQKKKGSPPLKDCRKTQVTLDKINIICSHMNYEEADYN